MDQQGRWEFPGEGTPRETRVGVIARTALVIRAKLGKVHLTEANRLVARKIGHDYMESIGMRPTHIVRMLDLATLMSFVPTPWDMEVAEVSSCYETHQLTRSYEDLTKDGLIFSPGA